MKLLYLYLTIILFCFTSKIQAQYYDTIYFWKSGQLILKRTIHPWEIDSIKFRRPIANLPRVKICNQVWTTQNLNVDKYRDGTVIPQVTNQTAWNNMTTGAWCYYNFDSVNGPIYGKLYNWYAVMGIYNAASASNAALRKTLAPNGWHIPSDSEWSILTDCLGGESIAGGKMKSIGTQYWLSPNVGATNTSGFNGLPGGWVNSYLGVDGFWWSSTSYNNDTNAWARRLINDMNIAYRGYYPVKYGLSIRLIKD